MNATGLERSVKAEVLEAIQRLPDDCTLDDILYHLHVFERVKAGRQAIGEGRFHTHEAAKERLGPWLSPSSGQTPP